MCKPRDSSSVTLLRIKRSINNFSQECLLWTLPFPSYLLSSLSFQFDVLSGLPELVGVLFAIFILLGSLNRFRPGFSGPEYKGVGSQWPILGGPPRSSGTCPAETLTPLETFPVLDFRRMDIDRIVDPAQRGTTLWTLHLLSQLVSVVKPLEYKEILRIQGRGYPNGLS